MPRTPDTRAYAPETLEGWYVHHQLFSIAGDADTSDLHLLEDTARVSSTRAELTQPEAGWTLFARVIGSAAEVMVAHFRPTLDAIGDAQLAFRRLPIARRLRPVYSFLSITEAGLYHLTAKLARDAAERGGAVGDEHHTAELARRAATERDSAHVQRRLFPTLPEGMPYVCFYPMSKKRETGQNWYTLSLDERSRLMHDHGLTGRKYGGRVFQVISGAVGFDAWEWGVTLFAKDPLDFKKLVSEMRFDEASSKYADFGAFYVGKVATLQEIEQLVETTVA
ncbi:MAG TPA: chlorite dismutase family protein [Gemmatimonadaceae bacterium]|nr:chlorite dismutase family protein [Gemmatimonadaceae bacterium]